MHQDICMHYYYDSYLLLMFKKSTLLVLSSLSLLRVCVATMYIHTQCIYPYILSYIPSPLSSDEDLGYVLVWFTDCKETQSGCLLHCIVGVWSDSQR